MSDEETEQQLLFEVLLEMWDSQKLVEYFRKEYQRGFDAGAASAASSKEDLAREYERGRQSVLDDVRKMFPPHVAAAGDRKQPLAKSIVEVPSEPETDPPKCTCEAGRVEGLGHHPECPLWAPLVSVEETQKRTGEAPKGPGRGPKPTNIDRPEGIPSNYEMCRMVLIDAGIPLTATEIRDRVAKRWWPNVPGDWKSSPFGFLGSGKLVKNADGKFILPIEVKKPAQPPKPDPQEVINQEVAKRDVVAVRPAIPLARREVVTPGAKLGPPARGEGVHFKHGDKIVTMHQREVDIAIRMRAAMGSGHLDAKFLAGAIGVKYEAESYMKEFFAIMNPKIAEVGLVVDFYKGFGFIMKEVA